MAFYKEKAVRLTGSEDNYVKVMKISPAEGELAPVFLPAYFS